MAPIARRTWAQIKTEAILRAGREDDANFAPRMEQFIAAAYLDLCHIIHHPELDKEDTSLTLTTSTHSFALPSTCYVLVGIWLRDPAGGAFLKAPVYRSPDLTYQEYIDEQRRPDNFSQFGRKVIFPSKPDLAYPTTLFFYADPTAPDFGSGSPEINRVWDEHIIEGAVARALHAAWTPQEAAIEGELLESWLSRQPQMAVRTGRLAPDEKVDRGPRDRGVG